jgi:hypothetical protein
VSAGERLQFRDAEPRVNGSSIHSPPSSRHNVIRGELIPATSGATPVSRRRYARSFIRLFTNTTIFLNLTPCTLVYCILSEILLRSTWRHIPEYSSQAYLSPSQSQITHDDLSFRISVKKQVIFPRNTGRDLPDCMASSQKTVTFVFTTLGPQDFKHTC